MQLVSNGVDWVILGHKKDKKQTVPSAKMGGRGASPGDLTRHPYVKGGRRMEEGPADLT